MFQNLLKIEVDISQVAELKIKPCKHEWWKCQGNQKYII